MDISYQYTMKRHRLGKQPQFCELGPELCDSIAPELPQRRHYMLRNPVHRHTQSTAALAETHVNTVRAEHSVAGVNHAEGGWPRDVSVADPEQTQRYRRKVEKEDNYIHCVMDNAPDMEHYALQNNCIDMYRTYYCEMPPLEPPERSSVRTVNVYRDCTPRRRCVSSVSWQAGAPRFAVAYNDVDVSRRSLAPLDAYLWHVDGAASPEVTLAPPSALLDLQFNRRDENVLAGGLLDGRVCVWDRRLGGAPVAACAPHVAHRDLVRRVLFVDAKSGREFFSGSPDGACKWWDLRNMSDFVDAMILDVVKYSFDVESMATSNGVSALEFEPTMPSRFMAGTENGLVLGVNRKGKTALEKIPIKYEAHAGPVRSVERNPAFLKNFLTVGDWTARVWSEECRDSAVLWSPPARHAVTAGAWSPTRLSLLALAQWDGSLALWDLLRSHHVPRLSLQLCSEPLLTLAHNHVGSLIACGSKNGHIYMVELSQSLTQSDKNDKSLLTLMFERESKRERILEARLRELRLRLRQAAEGGASPATSAGDLEAAAGDRDLSAAAADYVQLVKKEQLALA